MKLIKVKREVIGSGEGKMGDGNVVYLLLYEYSNEKEADKYSNELTALGLELIDGVSIGDKMSNRVYRQFKLREKTRG